MRNIPFRSVTRGGGGKVAVAVVRVERCWSWSCDWRSGLHLERLGLGLGRGGRRLLLPGRRRFLLLRPILIRAPLRPDRRRLLLNLVLFAVVTSRVAVGRRRPGGGRGTANLPRFPKKTPGLQGCAGCRGCNATGRGLAYHGDERCERARQIQCRNCTKLTCIGTTQHQAWGWVSPSHCSSAVRRRRRGPAYRQRPPGGTHK